MNFYWIITNSLYRTVNPQSVYHGVPNKRFRARIVVKYQRATQSSPGTLEDFSVNTPLGGIVEIIVKSHGSSFLIMVHDNSFCKKIN